MPNDKMSVEMAINPIDIFVPEDNSSQIFKNEQHNSADILDQNGIFCESNLIEFHCGRSGPSGSANHGQAINGH